MTPAQAAAYIRLKTRTNPTTLTDANILVLFNVSKNFICQRALEVDEDIWLVPTTYDLVADQREYPLSSNILSRIERVEAKLDGTNWLKLKSIDLTDFDDPVASETDITNTFSNNKGEAYYDIKRKAIYIYSGSITDVTDGLAIWQNTYPADISDMTSTTDMSVDPSTTTHGVPKALHKVICDDVVIEWKGSREKPIPLSDSELMHNQQIEQSFQTLKKSSYDTEVTGDLPNQVNMQGDDGSIF